MRTRPSNVWETVADTSSMTVVSMLTHLPYEPAAPRTPDSGPDLSAIASLLPPQRAVAFAAVEGRLTKALETLRSAAFGTVEHANASSVFDDVMATRRSFDAELAEAAKGNPQAEALLIEADAKLRRMMQRGLPLAADVGNMW